MAQRYISDMYELGVGVGESIEAATGPTAGQTVGARGTIGATVGGLSR